MFAKSQKPRAVVCHQRDYGHLEELDTFHSIPSALRYVAELNIPPDQLRIYQYLGNNVWLIHRVAASEFKPIKAMQLSLPF